MVQWIGAGLPIQGTQGLRSLVWEDSTCRRETKARGPQIPSSRAATAEAPTPRACALEQETPPNEKPMYRNEEQPTLTPTREHPPAAMETPPTINNFLKTANTRNERGDNSTAPMNIKRIIQEHHKWLYAHKFDNLDEIEQFLKRYNLPKFTQEI